MIQPQPSISSTELNTMLQISLPSSEPSRIKQTISKLEVALQDSTHQRKHKDITNRIEQLKKVINIIKTAEDQKETQFDLKDIDYTIKFLYKEFKELKQVKEKLNSPEIAEKLKLMQDIIIKKAKLESKLQLNSFAITGLIAGGVGLTPILSLDLIQNVCNTIVKAGTAYQSGGLPGLAQQAIGAVTQQAGAQVVQYSLYASAESIAKDVFRLGLQSNMTWIVAALSGIVQIGGSYIKYKRGDISKKEFFKSSIIISTSVVVSTVSGVAGSALGTLIGTMIFPGVGTVLGGVIGGVVTAVAGGSLTNKVMKEYIFKEDEVQTIEKSVQTPNDRYQYALSQLGVKDESNQDEVVRKKHDLLVSYHPDKCPADKKDENREKFISVIVNYEIIKNHRLEENRWKAD